MSCLGGVERLGRRLATFVLSLALVFVSRAASADDESAEALFRAGRALVDQGKVDDACPLFARSVEIGPSVGALVNLARCHEMQDKAASAWREYLEAAAMASREGDEERAAAARGYAARLEPQLSRIVVLPPEGMPTMTLALDGAELPPEAWGQEQLVDPGPHRIEARSGDYAWSSTVMVGRAGDRQVVTVPPPDPSDVSSEAPAGAWQRPFGIALASLGAAAIIAGTVLGVLVLDEVDRAESDPSLCPDKLCSPEGEAVIASADDKATAASLALGLGAAALIAGVVVYLTAPSESTGAQLVPVVTPSMAGLWVVGGF